MFELLSFVDSKSTNDKSLNFKGHNPRHNQLHFLEGRKYGLLISPLVIFGRSWNCGFLWKTQDWRSKKNCKTMKRTYGDDVGNLNKTQTRKCGLSANWKKSKTKQKKIMTLPQGNVALEKLFLSANYTILFLFFPQTICRKKPFWLQWRTKFSAPLSLPLNINGM
jgi:hypothetical protein